MIPIIVDTMRYMHHKYCPPPHFNTYCQWTCFRNALTPPSNTTPSVIFKPNLHDKQSRFKTSHVVAKCWEFRTLPTDFRTLTNEWRPIGDGFFLQNPKFERRRMAVSVEWVLKGCWHIASDLDPRGKLIVRCRMRRRLMMETIVIWQLKVKCFETYDRRLR